MRWPLAARAGHERTRATRAQRSLTEGGAAPAGGLLAVGARGPGRPSEVAPGTRRAGWLALRDGRWRHGARRVPRLCTSLPSVATPENARGILGSRALWPSGTPRLVVARRGEVTSGHATSRPARTASRSRARSRRLGFRRASSSRRGSCHNGVMRCAGINRRGVANERVAR